MRITLLSSNRKVIDSNPFPPSGNSFRPHCSKFGSTSKSENEDRVRVTIRKRLNIKEPSHSQTKRLDDLVYLATILIANITLNDLAHD